MTLLFVGAEFEDFTAAGGGWSVTTNSAYYRSAYARMGMYNSGSTTFDAIRLSSPSFTASSLLYVTARVAFISLVSTLPFMYLTTGGNARLRLRMSGTSTPTTIVLETWNGTSAVTLATSSLTVTTNTAYKIDWAVDYQAAGRLRLWVDQVLFIDYSGDPRVSGATSLNGLSLAPAHSAQNSSFSEVIVADEDTRPLSVKTLAPDATGDVTGWTSGTWQDIDETAASDADLAVSDTASQILSVNCTGMPSGASNLSVRAVKSVVYAARGATGPSKIDIGLRQSSTNAFASSQTLDTGYGVFSATWTINPITSAAFTPSEINALQLAYRSAT